MIQVLDPLKIPDWDLILAQSGDECFFHTRAWASVLENTYGYQPAYFAALNGGAFSLLMPAMRISSVLTGRRTVSLPFSDFCPAHLSCEDDLKHLLHVSLHYAQLASCRYAEWRHPAFSVGTSPPWRTYHTHVIDLRRSEPEVFVSIAESKRRNIHKAYREGVKVRLSDSADSLRAFYRLHCLTRKRKGVPPQPYAFFENIFRHVISRKLGFVLSAWYDHKIIAASVFFHFGKKALFKYGASDRRFQSLRSNDLVLWEAIKFLIDQGFDELNLGRTDPGDFGLLRFKRSWGAVEQPIHYYRYDLRQHLYLQERHIHSPFAHEVLCRLPVGLLKTIGAISYPHFG